MRVEPFGLPLADPLETAAGTIERREGFVVRLPVDGTEGVGEASPLPGWTESLADCRDALERVADADHAPEEARRALDPHATPAAAHAVELAVLDARARAAGVPLWQGLGGRHRESVPVNATVGDADADATAAAARDAVARGFETVKVKVGARPVDADAARVEAVRDAVGPDVALRADANGAWDRAQARDALDRFADTDVGLEYVEQPLPATDLAGLADLRAGGGHRAGDAGVAVAADESLAATSLEDVLAADAADVVVLKPMAFGGPARALAAAERARREGVTPVVTTTVDAVYARTAAVHVAAALPAVPACGLATADRLVEDLAADPAPVADGHVDVPDGPGNLGDGR